MQRHSNACGVALGLALAVVSIACGGDRGAGTDMSACVPARSDGGAIPQAKKDVLKPTRLLARASLVLRGGPPTDEELSGLLASGDDAAQLAFVDAFIDKTLAEPIFYRTMFELARDWLNVPLIPPTADEPEYGAEQQRAIKRCEATTAKAGAWHYYREGDDSCSGKKKDGSPIDELKIEPWWAPGRCSDAISIRRRRRVTSTRSPNRSSMPGAKFARSSSR